MTFHPTPLEGARIVRLEERSDDRGFFARSFCRREFEAAGLNPDIVQCNISHNRYKGTVRGLHYQKSPAAEAKLVRCTRGAIYDVIVDLRPGSSTFLGHFGIELTPENHVALYVPEHFAHGYITLTDDAEVSYQISEYYTPSLEEGFRYDDPALNIQWPVEILHISPKDAAWPRIPR